MAINYESQSSINETNSTVTLSHETKGRHRILFVSIGLLGSGTLVSLKYNGVDMVLVNGPQSNGTENYYLYYLMNPTLGTNDIVLVSSSSVNSAIEAISYSGASQTNITEISNSAGSSSGLSPYTISTTTVADNCWVVGRARNTATASVPSTGVTQRCVQFSSFGDSNGPVTPAGLYGMTWTCTNGAVSIYGQACSFAPSLLPPFPFSPLPSHYN